MLDDGARLRVLAEMDIEVYRLRSAPAPAALAATTETLADPDTAARLIVVCARGMRVEARTALLLKLLPHALGIARSALALVDADGEGQVAALPQAPAFLLLGNACAAACAAHLTLAELDAATLAVIAAPDDALRDAPAKRALWQMLKPLARRLRAAGS